MLAFASKWQLEFAIVGVEMSDIAAVLNEAEAQLAAIRRIYGDTLSAQSVSSALQAKIKSCVEHQRSALDYIAHAIVSLFGKAGSKTYYPLAPTPAAFPSLFNGRMPGVATARPDIRDAIERHQPYSPGHHWLARLRDLTNENKHHRLTPQTKRTSLELRGGPRGGYIGAAGGAGIQLGEGAAIVLTDGASISFGGPGPLVSQNVVQTTYVDWLFADAGDSALATLDLIQRKIRPAISDIQSTAGF